MLEYTRGLGESENLRMSQPELEPGQSEKKLFLFTHAHCTHQNYTNKFFFLLFLMNLVPILCLVLNNYLIYKQQGCKISHEFLLLYWLPG